MIYRLFLMSVAVLVAMSTNVETARAEQPSAKKFVTGAVKRARRAISIGPAAGAALAYLPSASDVDASLSLGLGLYLYDIPVVPSPKAIQALIKERVEAKVKERVRAMVERGEPPPTQRDLEGLGREIFYEVKQEVLGEKSVRARRLEKPRLAFDFEGAYFMRAETWQLRTTLGFGMGPVTIGPTFALHWTDNTGLSLGPEVDVRLLPGKGPRSPVVDVFLRADFALLDRDVTSDSYGLGLRLLLDVI